MVFTQRKTHVTLICLIISRPSGTEDVVRVYAEADTQVGCDKCFMDYADILR